MEYRHLKFFVTLAEELHFTRASRRLNVAQPHLSQEIRRLEAEIGTPLLTRTSRRVELTEAGRVFRDHALQILQLTNDARGAANRAGDGTSGRLSIGFAGSTGYDVLPRSIINFRAKWPLVELSLKQMHTHAQIEALRESRIDIGFMRRLPHKESELVSKVIRSERLVLALSTLHPLSRMKVVPWSSLRAQPWIAFDRTPYAGLHGDLQAACAAAGFEPIVSQEAGEIPTMINLVASGLGLALLPESVMTIRRKGVVYRQLDPEPAPSQVVASWRADSDSPTLRNFRKALASI
jgi:DNA-binding transcriptional LysR family regulator